MDEFRPSVERIHGKQVCQELLWIIRTAILCFWSDGTMNRKNFVVLMIAGLVIVCLGLPSYSQAFDQKDVLRGLTGIKVVVEPITPDIERLGLTKNQIQSNVESQIRKVGIKVLKNFKPPAMTSLYINILAMNPREAKAVVVYSITLMVFENAYLKRDIGTVGDLKEVRAADWVKGSVGFVGVRNIRDIYKKLELLVDQFISDYLAVNQ
jgi:hypothetical protein